MSLCDGFPDCPMSDDEDPSMCSTGVYRIPSYCTVFLILTPRQVTSSNVLCTLNDHFKRIMWNGWLFVPNFSLSNTSVSPPVPLLHIPFAVRLFSRFESHQRRERQITALISHCNNGLLVYLLRDNGTERMVEERCLCPPTTYGDQCQYQNERVSISLLIVTPDWRTSFTFVAYLIESRRETVLIHSYHQIMFLSTRDCGTKFHFHLIYMSRPKATESSYVVRIDAFETETLVYRASWSYPILFTFLPVYRLAVQLVVPTQRIQCRLQCGEHGSCALDANLNIRFCQCDPGWNGSNCQTTYKCHCSPDSICIGSMNGNNRSICVCPLQKYGPRCYLTNNFCVSQSEARKCQHGGHCVARDRRFSTEPNTFCTCPDRFGGHRCEHVNFQLDISLAHARLSTLPDSILLHFISVPKPWGEHERVTKLSKIPLDQDSVTLYWKNPFNLLFAQLFNEHFYLLLVQVEHKPSVHHKLTLQPEKRCPSIRELLESSIVTFPPLRRVKYYHVPCQEQDDLACFHDDEQFLCLCTHDRRANCFTFDHRMDYDCRGFNYLCENGGRCFQDNATCPSVFSCACPVCFFGHRCQFSSKGFSLSLDDILGYQIKPLTPFVEQRTVVKVSLAATVTMLTVGVLNSVLSITTFQATQPRQVGCGIYLLVASIISLLSTVVFTLKFFILLLAQMGTILDRGFLVGQCVVIDFLLKILVQICDWLYACVAVERAFTVIRGIHFDKTRSKQAAKWIMFAVVLFVSATSIHEPIHRHLLDDEEEGRRWCIVQYSKETVSMFTTYTTALSIIHFIGPFSINIISALIIIISAAQRRSAIRNQIKFRSHLRYHFNEQKHLLISPIGLVLLALPRLLLHFVLDCLKSAHDSVSLFLLGYFLSFVPPLLTFLVFVLPSENYMKDFKSAIVSVQKCMHRYSYYRA